MQRSFVDTRPAQLFLRWITTVGLPDDRDAALELWQRRRIGLHALAGWRVGIVLLVGLFVALAIRDHRKPEFIAAILAGGALLVTYVEWMLGRRETSMDKFYERLETANEHRSNLEDADMKMTATERYVFTELDNLEYVIERYRFGYMSPSLARRGVNTFVSRLGISGFKSELRRVFEKDCAYNVHTCEVVRKLIEDHDGRKTSDGATAVG